MESRQRGGRVAHATFRKINERMFEDPDFRSMSDEQRFAYIDRVLHGSRTVPVRGFETGLVAGIVGGAIIGFTLAVLTIG